MGHEMRGAGRLIAGIGGFVLIGALFVPWAELAGGTVESGWEVAPAPAIVCVLAGVAAIGTALTGGRIGFFRPDVSFTGAADLLSVASSLMLGWLVAFDLPDGATAGAGLFVALGAAVVTACVVADWRPLRGAPPFQRLPE